MMWLAGFRSKLTRLAVCLPVNWLLKEKERHMDSLHTEKFGIIRFVSCVVKGRDQLLELRFLHPIPDMHRDKPFLGHVDALRAKLLQAHPPLMFKLPINRFAERERVVSSHWVLQVEDVRRGMSVEDGPSASQQFALGAESETEAQVFLGIESPHQGVAAVR